MSSNIDRFNFCDFKSRNIAVFTQKIIVDDPAFMIFCADKFLLVACYKILGMLKLFLELCICQHFADNGIVLAVFGIKVIDGSGPEIQLSPSIL